MFMLLRFIDSTAGSAKVGTRVLKHVVLACGKLVLQKYFYDGFLLATVSRTFLTQQDALPFRLI